MVLPELVSSGELVTNDRLLYFAHLKPYTGARRGLKNLFVYEKISQLSHKVKTRKTNKH